MADRKNPFLELGMGEYKGIHRMPFALKERATTHEINRQRVVGSILLELHIMAIMGIIKRELPLTLRGAVLQSLGGNREDSTEAAHCVPRQVLFGNDTPQDILLRSFPERAWALSLLFAETDILPGNYNKCDSRAERTGLKDAFRKACEFMIETAHNNSRPEAIEIISRADHGYGIYKNIGIFALRESEERIKDKLKPKFLFPKDKAKWTEQLQITRQYLETLEESPGKEKGISLSKIEGLIRIYKMPLNV